MFYIPDSYIEDLINEDLQLMDLTVMAMNIEDKPGRVECFPKEDCIVAGVELAARIFAKAGVRVEQQLASGTCVQAGQVCLSGKGTAGAIHAVYKLAQNVMEYSSGIAVRTAAMVANAKKANPNVHVAVTRKHFPGGKALSLAAALAGGASLHRLGLWDSILVFDQHRTFADDFIKLLPVMAAKFPEKKIAVEADSPAEGLAYVRAGAHIVQCERFAPDKLADFVKQARALAPQIVVAAAGGVNAANAEEYAATGIEVIVTSWPYFGKTQDIKMRITCA